jgi:hypothetical protein
VGKDIWRADTAGRRLRVAIDFLLPYAGRESQFPYPDLKPEASESSLELFSRAAWGYADPKYARAAAIVARLNPGSAINLKIAPYVP